MRVTLGEPTLEQLGERLADEVRRALVESVDGPARSVPRARSARGPRCSARCGARSRACARSSRSAPTAPSASAGTAPEGAIALAPWLHQDVAGADRALARVGAVRPPTCASTGGASSSPTTIPGVTWFIADLLRTAGCDVHEALDGATALELAFPHSPELVVSDILMPGLDGFALCRALRRDVALRDTPVILLSWKEDLLQRVRELGASAAAYLRKESDSRAILARVREVLRPRARIEVRLRGEGEVRGRLDGLIAALAARARLRDAPGRARRRARRVVPLRGRDPRRRAAAGDAHRRRRRLPARRARPRGDARRRRGALRRRPLERQRGRRRPSRLARRAARASDRACARRAAAATTARARERRERRARRGVRRGVPAGDAGAGARPHPARRGGESPRQMLLGGEVAPSLLEDVLADLAARGAITAVRDARGKDLLGQPGAGSDSLTHAQALSPPTPSPTPASDVVARQLPAIAEASLKSRRPVPRSAVPASHGEQEGSAASWPASGDAEPPSSLEDAVIRAMSDRSPEAPGLSSSEQPPIVEPSELRPRSSNPPAAAGAGIVGSLPPDALVPGDPSGDMPAAAVAPQPEPTEPFHPELSMTDGTRGKTPEVSVPVTLESSAKMPPVLEPSKTTPERSRTIGAAPAPRAGESRMPAHERSWRFFAVLIIFGVVIGAGIRWCDAPRASATSTDAP